MALPVRELSWGQPLLTFALGVFERMTILGYILIVIGVGAWFAGDVMYLNATYRRGLGWFFGGMFLPLVDLVFLFTHWRVAYRPFALSLAGLALAVVGALIVG